MARTSKQLWDGVRSRLEARAKQKNNHRSQHRSFATVAVGDRSIDQRSKPRRQEKRRHKPALEAGVGGDAGEVSSEPLHGEDA